MLAPDVAPFARLAKAAATCACVDAPPTAVNVKPATVTDWPASKVAVGLGKVTVADVVTPAEAATGAVCVTDTVVVAAVPVTVTALPVTVVPAVA